MKKKEKQRQLFSVPYSKNLGAYFKDKRSKAGVTQVDLSVALGLKSPQFISNVERGICAYTSDQLPIVIKTCEIDGEEMMNLFLKKYRSLLEDSII